LRWVSGTGTHWVLSGFPPSSPQAIDPCGFNPSSGYSKLFLRSFICVSSTCFYKKTINYARRGEQFFLRYRLGDLHCLSQVFDWLFGRVNVVHQQDVCSVLCHRKIGCVSVVVPDIPPVIVQIRIPQSPNGSNKTPNLCLYRTAHLRVKKKISLAKKSAKSTPQYTPAPTTPTRERSAGPAR
jgi:hypothetical protein